MTVESAVRKKVVIALRKSNPCATLEEIGQDVNVSRERVRQILNKANLPTRKHLVINLCNNCGGNIRRYNRNQQFCNKECRRAYSRIQIACSFCGALKEYRAKEVTWNIEHNGRSSDLFFCSKQCQGKWLGKNHGIKKGAGYFPHLEARKYNHEGILYLKSLGWSYRAISESTNVSVKAIYQIVYNTKRGNNAERSI